MVRNYRADLAWTNRLGRVDAVYCVREVFLMPASLRFSDSVRSWRLA
jgi:hypothetical protein